MTITYDKQYIFSSVPEPGLVKIESINETSTRTKSLLTMNNVCERCTFELNVNGKPKQKTKSYSCQAINTNGTSDKILFTIYISGEYVGKVDLLPFLTYLLIYAGL